MTKLAGLSGLAFLLFNFPFLKIWGKDGMIMGIPRFIFCVFFIWGLLMLAIVLVLRRDAPKLSSKSSEE